MQEVTVNVYNIQGKRVAALVNQHLAPGFYDFYRDRLSISGGRVPGGVYVIEYITGKTRRSERLILY